VDGAFEFSDRYVEYVRIHTGVHVSVCIDGRATDGVVETHGVRNVRPRRRRVPAAVCSVRVRGADGRHVRDIRSDRPLETDGVSARTVRVGPRDSNRQQHDIHVSGPRTRSRAGIRHRGLGPVPHVPAGHVRDTGVPRGASAGRVREAHGRCGRLQSDHHVRRLVQRDRRRRLWVLQRVRFGPGGRAGRPVADTVDGHSRLGRGVPALERRRRVDHHQTLRLIETLHAPMTGVLCTPAVRAPVVRAPFNNVAILYIIIIISFVP